MLKDILSTCGLTVSEKTVFLYLVEHGANLASIISKRTGMKRPTVYACLNNLINLGIVLKQYREKATYFDIISLPMVPQILENHAKKKFVEVKEALQFITPELLEISQNRVQKLGGFSIEIIESMEAIYQILEDSLLGGNFDAIFNPDEALNKDTKIIVKRFLEKTGKSNPHIREIVVDGPMADWYEENITNPNHLVKRITKDKKIFSDIILLNGVVIILHYYKDKQVGIKIHQKDYYESMETIFEMLWKRLNKQRLH